MKLGYIQRGKPTQNALLESLSGNSRGYSPKPNWFMSLEDARSEIEYWSSQYNYVRPDRSLGKKPPGVFAIEAAQYGIPTSTTALGKEVRPSVQPSHIDMITRQ